MKNIAVFASGNGTNFEALARAVKAGKVRGAKIAQVICDQPGAAVIARAKRFGVEVALVPKEAGESRESFEKKIIRRLQARKIDLIVLAGFMRILSASFVRRYRNRIINIHPSLLPAFKGGHAIRDAFLYGVKVTGVTVHFVDEHMDNGPIILQEQIAINKNDTLASLEARIHAVEHRLYRQAVQVCVLGKLQIKGRKVFSR